LAQSGSDLESGFWSNPDNFMSCRSFKILCHLETHRWFCQVAAVLLVHI